MNNTGDCENSSKQVVNNATTVIEPPDCHLLLQKAPDVKKENLFSAQGKHFYFNRTLVNWYKASEFCQTRGMQLASLKTLGQVEAVAKELSNRGLNYNAFWLSATDIGKTLEFQWLDGTLVDESTWFGGLDAIIRKQPDNFGAGKHTCVVLNTHPYNKLFNWGCSNTFNVLCEIPATLTLCFNIKSAR